MRTSQLLAALLLAVLATAAPAAPTADLFHFRPDPAPEQTTRIHIDAGRQATTPVQQDLFGNFIEHLGGVVYEGVWADALLNPNLEQIEPKDTEPPAWDMAGEATWAQGGYLSPRSVRLAGADAMLSQRVFLPVHRIRRYTLTLYARASGGAGNLTLSLAGLDAHAGATFARTALTVSGTAWQKQTMHWSLPADAPARGEPERFVVAGGGGAAVDVDQIELFPDDAVDGLDPDVIRAARAWHIPILRLAGNFSSGYHWRDGVGPRLARPTQRNAAWGGIETNHFGTDEYLDFCRRIGATPQIGVNAGDGTPEEAAAWVRYCNAKGERVPVWEIGNELYGGWQIGHTDAAGNAARFVKFRDAMLKADPRIKVIATGKGEEYLPEGLKRNHDWNEAVLRAAVAGGGQAPDWISLHPLVPLPGNLREFSYAERWESGMAHPYFLGETLLPDVVQTVQSVEGANAPTRIAPTEWGFIVGGDGWQNGPNHDVEAGAVFAALTLNAMLRHSDWVTLANITALMHGGGIKKPNGVVIEDPQYFTQQLYSVAEPRYPVETTWDGPGRDVPQRGYLPAVVGVPDVDVFSALGATRHRLSAFLVNRSLTDVRPVVVDIAGFPAGKASAVILTATDPQARNTWEHPDTVAPHPFPLPAGAAAHLSFTLPPHSLVVLTVNK